MYLYSCIFPVLYRLSMGMVKPSDCNALMCTVQQTLILDDDIHLLQTVFRQETDLRSKITPWISLSSNLNFVLTLLENILLPCVLIKCDASRMSYLYLKTRKTSGGILMSSKRTNAKESIDMWLWKCEFGDWYPSSKYLWDNFKFSLWGKHSKDISIF